jgi:hypothetical protein
VTARASVPRAVQRRVDEAAKELGRIDSIDIGISQAIRPIEVSPPCVPY